jgi:hypothetical protein
MIPSRTGTTPESVLLVIQCKQLANRIGIDDSGRDETRAHQTGHSIRAGKSGRNPEILDSRCGQD